MIAKAAVISHGANAVRYATEKDKSEIIKLNRLPDDIPSEGIWQRMVIHQKKFEAKLSRHRPLQNNAIRIEVSPARDESEGWTHDDWEQLANDFVQEFDAVNLSKRAGRASAARTNLAGSQYVVALHRDSRSGIAHLHIVANRVDMEGNVNDAHFIYERAMEAARRINIRRGWLTAEEFAACIVEMQKTAVLLFAGYMDAAVSMSESHGGGGSVPSSGWGRDKDEDEREWARRCTRMAMEMNRPKRRSWRR